jgi:SAM-dependent methyltransferase
MDSNSKTLETYNEHFSNYIDGTVQVTSGFQAQWLEYLLSLRSEDSRILELGSAFGRDAIFITGKGFTNFLATDAFDAAVEMLKAKGLNAKKLNLLTDAIEGEYDLILASAVFLHFTATEFNQVLAKIKAALSTDGILGFSVKNGSGEEWSDAKMGAPRFFHYWGEDDLRRTLDEVGYTIVDLRHSDDDKWIHVTAR